MYKRQVQSHAALAAALGVRLLASDLAAPGVAFDVMLNATASSLQGHASPVPATVLRPGTLAAVSYTHLDVYKRQMGSTSNICRRHLNTRVRSFF